MSLVPPFRMGRVPESLAPSSPHPSSRAALNVHDAEKLRQSGYHPLLWGLHSGCQAPPAEGRLEPQPGLTIQPLINPLSFHPLNLRLSICTGSLGVWGTSRTSLTLIHVFGSTVNQVARARVGGGSPGAAGLGLGPWPSSCGVPGRRSSGGPGHAALRLRVQALIDGGE